MAKLRLILGLFFMTLAFSSCGKAEAYFHVFRGNYNYGRGDFQEANVMYLKAAEKGLYGDIISYNLGNVYQALGESEAALEQWAEARESGHKALLPDVLYNEGILRYDMGEYEQAYLLFRDVLQLDPLREEARVNLEYAFKKMNARDQAPRSAVVVPDEQQETGNLDRVLQYVKRKEQTLWGSGTTETEYQRDW